MLYTDNEKCQATLSALGAGTWSLGGKNAYGLVYGQVEEDNAINALRVLIDNGVNVVDTAPVYGVHGASETIVGKALRDGYRDKVFLVTKFGNYNDAETGKRIINNSREDIMKEIDESLDRLETDHIDLYIMHYPDPVVPVSETMDALNEIKAQGKIKHIGVSNVDRRQLEECMEFAEIDAIQLPYSMVNRSAEDLLVWSHSHGLMTMAYGAMGAGILSGSYRELPHFSEKDIRYTFYPYFKEPMFSEIQRLLQDMDIIAERHECPLSHVALSWVAHKEFVTTSLVGSTNVNQARENARAYSLTLSEDEMAFLDASIKRNLDETGA
ncbi:aldo/keto reductase [Tractidigestivibacter montrealensis]|uniref:Aldo/keto reductase n=1 Tax=Tractidigestivibacter montrealensis TaxID=2972466 RepID=A0ABT1ZAN8_9ACTN|nr:aldo/keto reductase [Tractidigestivibacter montrealensis]MCR9037283.1 aldo/keto reductase [Tractidigestivibacter montrealensis]